jgi:serine/threonine protein kinase
MSPEQAREAKDVSAATDQYSIAVILYQAVTGERPFAETTLYKLLNAIVAGDFKKPRQLVDDLPPEFESVVLRGMEVSPEDRFPSMRAMGAALLPFASPHVRTQYEAAFRVGDDTIIPHSTDRVIAHGTDKPPESGVQSAISTFGKSAGAYSITPVHSRRRLGLSIVAALAILGVVVAVTLPWNNKEPIDTITTSTLVVDPPSNEVTSATSPDHEASAQKKSETKKSEPLPDEEERDSAPPLRRVETVPSGAEVWIAGKQVGKTPYDVALPDGVEQVPITLKLAGHEDSELTVRRDTAEKLQVSLSATPKRKVNKAGGDISPLPTLAPR